jgi:hypothetical protein
MDWIDLVEDRDHWIDLMNMVLNELSGSIKYWAILE